MRENRPDAPRRRHAVLVRLTLFLIVVLAAAALAPYTVRAGAGCDQSEAVACIPLPPDNSTTPPAGSPSTPAAVSGAAIPAPAVICPASVCCGTAIEPLTGAAAPSAAPNIPAVCQPGSPPVTGWCPPLLAGASDAPSAPSAAVAAPVPLPLSCSPERGIYTTINYGNAADVRALRTLSTQGLSAYWRGDALNQIENQVAGLQLAGESASTRLYSIQVQDSSINYVNRTATVHTLEHWLYQQRSLDDGSLLASQDEWDINEYDLNAIGGTWYINGNTVTETAGPSPVDAAGG